MANPGYDPDSLSKLGALLVKKPQTAKQLAGMYRKTPVAMKRMIKALGEAGFAVTAKVADAPPEGKTGKVGRRPKIYSATAKK